MEETETQREGAFPESAGLPRAGPQAGRSPRRPQVQWDTSRPEHTRSACLGVCVGGKATWPHPSNSPCASSTVSPDNQRGHVVPGKGRI